MTARPGRPLLAVLTTFLAMPPAAVAEGSRLLASGSGRAEDLVPDGHGIRLLDPDPLGASTPLD